MKKPRAPRTQNPAPQPAMQPANRPTTGHRPPIPAHVRREVITRDGGRCQAKLHDGTICGSKVRLQLDHTMPVALGGPNIQLRCERHNQLAAREVFGETWMDMFPTA